MTKGKNIELNTRLSREDVAGILEAFSEGLKEGSLNVQKSSGFLKLDVPKFFDLEIKAMHDNDDASFQITGSWRTDRVGTIEDPKETTKEKITVTIAQGSSTLVNQEFLQSAEEFLKQTVTTVSSVAKEASVKATEVLSKATEKGLNKAATQTASSTLAKFAESALHSLASLKEKAQHTFHDIKKDAGDMSAKRKALAEHTTSSVHRVASEDVSVVESKVDSATKIAKKVGKDAEKTLEKKASTSAKKIATTAKKATTKAKKAVAKKTAPKPKSTPKKVLDSKKSDPQK